MHGILGCPLALVLLGPAVQAQTARSPADLIADRQRGALEAMRESVARQRLSVQRQMAASGTDGFFRLAPPAAARTAAAVPPSACPPLPDGTVDALVAEAAQRDGVAPELLRGIMRQESGFRPCSISPKGALGLMQLMPATAWQFGVANPFDARANLDAGAKLLKQLLGRYDGDVAKALAAYNAGPGRVDAAGGIPPIRETLDYVRQILSVLPLLE